MSKKQLALGRERPKLACCGTHRCASFFLELEKLLVIPSQVPPIPKIAGAPTAEPATPTAAAANGSTPPQLAAPDTNGNLPAWTGLPPPPAYLKVGGPIVPNCAIHSNAPVKGEAQAAVGVLRVCTAKGGCSARNGGAMEGGTCFSGATGGTPSEGGLVGEKRPRWALETVVDTVQD